jgi:LDH2 family malate/lactate/ureidoglycolate dehydrogenase
VAGEAGKRLIENLWNAIANRFQNDDRAKRALTAVETEKSPEAVKKLEFYLNDEMAAAPEFAELLKQLVREIQAQQPAARLEMVTNLELEGDLKAKDMMQRSNTGKPIDQTMLKNVKAKNIDLGNLSQDQ